jgi:hypothetical protein
VIRLQGAFDAWIHAATTLDASAFFGNWITILILSCGLILWALTSARKLHRAALALRNAIDGATAGLRATPSEARAFVVHYERIATQLGEAPIIGPAWRDWRATLIVPDRAGVPVRSTVRPETYLTVDLLRDCGINPRHHAAMPNLLVGVGLLMTFLGLSIALNAAGGIADPTVDFSQRQSGLKGLLDAASAKFITSLVGLFCSITYTAWRSAKLNMVEASLGQFLVALEERIPLATAAALQAEANAILERSRDVQETFATELAVNIGSRLDDALDQRLGEHIGPLREAIEKLSEGIGTSNEDALKKLVEDFKSTLRGGADDQMAQIAEMLRQTADGMTGIQTGLSDAAARMGTAADQMAEQMGRNAEDAMRRVSVQIDGLVGELRKLAEQSRTAGEDSLRLASERIASATASFEATARLVAEHLSGGAGDAARRMTEAMETMQGQFARLADELGGGFRTAGAAFVDTGRESAATLSQAAQAAADALRAGGEASGQSLRSGGTEASRGLTVAADSLAAPVRDMGLRLTALLDAAGEVKAAMDAMRQAALDAAVPLRVSAAELGTAGTSAARAASDMAGVMVRIVPLTDALVGVATRLSEVERRVSDLSSGMAGAAQRFEGLDGSLAATFRNLQTGLQGFSTQIAGFVQATNKDMAQAVTALQSAIAGLTEAIEDAGLTPAARK